MKNKILSCIFLFILLNLVLSSIKIVSVNNPSTNHSNIDPSIEIIFNATSPYDFFNETKDPRYHIVSQPMNLITSPHKGFPTISSFTDSFTIKVATSESIENCIFQLVSLEGNVSLEIISSNYQDEEWVFTVLPENPVVGLYDLQLNCNQGVDYQTHAVKLVQDKEYPFSFIHISDSHFPIYTGVDINSTNINLQVIENINALQPDFVIVTGDLIQGPTLYFLNPVTGKHMKGVIELRLALWALDSLDLPVYYVHGNHEFSQSTMIPDNLEDNWYNYLGPIRYQNFTFLDWTMVGFGSSFEGLNTEELQQMQVILSQNSDGATMLYYHHDFHYDATNFIKRYPIEVALYGHEHRDDRFLSGGVLYHVQRPLFTGGYSQSTILN